MSATTQGDIPQNTYYMRSSEVVAAPAALSTSVYASYLAVDGTDPHTLAAPAFAGQYKYIATISGANTPSSTVTVTGMRVAAQDVFSGFGAGAVATTPMTLLLYSPDGVAWDIVSMVGVTVA